MLLREARTALLMLIVLTVLTGLIYPGVVTGITQVAFHHRANGSFETRAGQTIGSPLLGQSFVDSTTNQTLVGYFRGRPSAASVTDDGTLVSSGSNYGPTNHLLVDRVDTDAAIIRQENGLAADAPLPVDLVTASGSGLDPDISPAAAQLQVARVAQQREISVDEVKALVQDHTTDRFLGILGEPRVNVLELNLALDERAPMPAAPAVSTPVS